VHYLPTCRVRQLQLQRAQLRAHLIPPGTQRLRCQYLYFCTSKASKLRSHLAPQCQALLLAHTNRGTHVVHPPECGLN
jgi:hypothetical protein